MDPRLDASCSAMTLFLRSIRVGLWLIPCAFLTIFFVYPLVSIFAMSVFPDSSLDLSGVETLIRESYYREVIWFTFYQAVLSTFFTVVLAVPAAYVFTRYQFRGKRVLMSLVTLPFVLPTVLVAVAFSALLGENGIVNDFLISIFRLNDAPIQVEDSLAIILIVHVFYNFSIVFRIVAGYWANQSPKIEEAATVLGCSGIKLWLYVRLPILRPAILASAILTFIFTYTSFGVVLIFGGLRYETVEVVIYKEAYNYLNLSLAAVLSFVQIGIMLAMMYTYTRLQRNVVMDLQSVQRVARRPRSIPERLTVNLTLIFMVILIFTPLLALVMRSLWNGAVTFQNYAQIFAPQDNYSLSVTPLESTLTSVSFAIITTIVAVTLGLITCYMIVGIGYKISRWLDPFFMLPLATSAVTLGFGFIIALDEPPLNLRTSWVLIPIAHTLVAMPFVIRSILPLLRGIPSSVRESASVLGASPLQTLWMVDLPMISRGIVVGAIFAFTMSMGEFGASLFIARPETTTMPILIYRLLGRVGAANYGQALALSVLLMSICAISFVLIERTRDLGVGEF
ncbi:MAG: iron ABC transporter permease [Aggregatilineales bacterium]